MVRFLKNKMFLIVVGILITVLFVGCQSSGEQGGTNDNGTNDGNEQNNVNGSGQSSDEHPIVTITMENGGEVTIELYPETAPNTVNNFISLVENKFYDGLIFHRVIPGFMIQGGDPEGNGTGGPGYSIKGEFAANGFENKLMHERGVISMARSRHPDSAGSQFFIVTDQAQHLNGEYAAFGKVTSGMDVVDEIVSHERDSNDKPLEDQVIQSMEIDLAGYNASEPEKIQ